MEEKLVYIVTFRETCSKCKHSRIGTQGFEADDIHDCYRQAVDYLKDYTIISIVPEIDKTN